MIKYSRRLLLNLYRTMLRIRLCEEHFVEPIIKGEIKCPVHLYTGQEAVAAGVAAALRSNDYIFGNHRSHGHYLAHGGDMKELVAEVFCRESGCARGRGGSMHVCAPEIGMLGAAPIVGGTISLAVGSALASKIRKDGRVTVSFFGDGATGEGVLYESLNLAALRKLPVIFACENNLYSTHMSIGECRSDGNIFNVAAPFCIPGFRVDGNDVLTVYETTRKASEHCRKGKGPVFIEFLTYRMRGHVGPNDNIQGTQTDIRPKAEVKRWRGKDPIRGFEKYLIGNRLLTEKDLSDVRSETESEVDDAFLFAKASPYPEERELMRYVYR